MLQLEITALEETDVVHFTGTYKHFPWICSTFLAQNLTKIYPGIPTGIPLRILSACDSLKCSSRDSSKNFFLDSFRNSSQYCLGFTWNSVQRCLSAFFQGFFQGSMWDFSSDTSRYFAGFPFRIPSVFRTVIPPKISTGFRCSFKDSFLFIYSFCLDGLRKLFRYSFRNFIWEIFFRIFSMFFFLNFSCDSFIFFHGFLRRFEPK